MVRLLAPDLPNLGGLLALGAMLAVAYLSVPSRIAKYGVGLLLFAVWMAWFVLAAVWVFSNVEP